MSPVNDSPTNTLLSAVFVLRYGRAFRSDKHMGRAAHKLALSLIGQANAALADALHNHDGLLPITISDLFQSDSHHHWLRITALRSDVTGAVLALVGRDDLHVDGWTVVQGMAVQHDWSGSTHPDDLLRDRWQPVRTLKLEFASPTSFRSVGLYRPLPEPGLVFKSLYERWRGLMDTALPFSPDPADLETFASHLVSLDYHRVSGVRVSMKHGHIPAFRGTAHYLFERENTALAKRDPELYARLHTQRGEYASLLNLLAHFGFYSGVGIKTAQGMGMLRLV